MMISFLLKLFIKFIDIKKIFLWIKKNIKKIIFIIPFEIIILILFTVNPQRWIGYFTFITLGNFGYIIYMFKKNIEVRLDILIYINFFPLIFFVIAYITQDKIVGLESYRALKWMAIISLYGIGLFIFNLLRYDHKKRSFIKNIIITLLLFQFFIATSKSPCYVWVDFRRIIYPNDYITTVNWLTTVGNNNEIDFSTNLTMSYTIHIQFLQAFYISHSSFAETEAILKSKLNSKDTINLMKEYNITYLFVTIHDELKLWDNEGLMKNLVNKIINHTDLIYSSKYSYILKI
ncbi:MAG: hypothetical protein ACTSRP_07670 [Candidatus Helarchaeota archaeon]